MCTRVKKLNQVDAASLRQLFPASSSTPRKRPSTFDPTRECVALAQKKKKKAARVKPSKLTIIALREQDVKRGVPRGKYRQSLATEDRVQKLEFHRNMTPLEVQNILIRGFQSIKLGQYRVLTVDSTGLLVDNDNQSPGGDALISDAQKRKCVYICDGTKKQEARPAQEVRR